MNLYCVKYTPPTSNTGLTEDLEMVSWAGTIRDAKRLQRSLEQDHGRENVDNYEAVNVPTDKPSLLAWLNSNAYIKDINP